jgi:predicted DNA-binding transcriptional regulator YafY
VCKPLQKAARIRWITAAKYWQYGGMPRADRLLRLIQVLRRRRQPVSARQLADELEISVRSVYRDVQTLRAEGATIDGEPGVGYLLRPGFMLPPLMFTDEELEALLLGLRLTAEHADEALGRAAAEVVAKLRAVLPKDLRTLLDETGLLAGPALQRPQESVDLAELRRAIREQRKARIVYGAPHGVRTERVIWPLGLGFFERSRVLVAWCELRADFRAFRSDRIVDWQTLTARLPRSRIALLREWRARERIPEPI